MSATVEKPLIEQLHEKRTTLIDEAGEAVEQRKTERQEFEAREQSDNKPTDEERTAFAEAEESFNEDFQRRQGEIATLDRRIAEEEIRERRREDAARASRVQVVSEPLTYRGDNAHEVSYFRDLATVSLPSVASRMKDPGGARERLEAHAAEMNVEMPKRNVERERRAQQRIAEAEARSTGGQRRGFETSPFEQRVNPNRTDGQGGYFVPPLWLIDEYIPALRAGRVAAGLARQMELPEGTDSINIPKIATTTQVGVQTADNAAVASQDFTDTSVSANVKTLAGQEDVAIQLLEQSPGQIIDQVVIEDLMADYNRLVDTQVLSGTGSSGQITGITQWGGTQSVTYSNATPAPSDLFAVEGALASRIATKRFSTENVHFLLHPRRWFWHASGLDGNGRPIAESAAFGPVNVAALSEGNIPAEGLVGRSPLLPQAGVYIDANVTTADTTGGGTGQDEALACKWDDLWLFEGALRTRVLSEILSGTLEVRFQVYNYVAFLARYGESIAIATGSGFKAPTAIGGSVVF